MNSIIEVVFMIACSIMIIFPSYSTRPVQYSNNNLIISKILMLLVFSGYMIMCDGIQSIPTDIQVYIIGLSVTVSIIKIIKIIKDNKKEYIAPDVYEDYVKEEE